jgi:LysR family transcriptional regulator, glycine cleavage system transcriptional activator
VNLPPTFVVKWLIPRMQRFLKELPEIDLKVSTSAKLVDFSRDDYDVDIRYGRGVYPGMRSELCLPVAVFPVCSPLLPEGEHPLREPAGLKAIVNARGYRYGGTFCQEWPGTERCCRYLPRLGEPRLQ